MTDCKICNSYVNSPQEDGLCIECRSLQNAFEACGLTMTFCDECIYAVRNAWETGTIYCHRKAPLAIENVFKADKWPKMKASDWCGEGRRIKLLGKEESHANAKSD